MGFSCCWIAVEAGKQKVLDALGLAETEQTMMPGAGRPKMSCRETPAGWTIVFNESFNWATPERVSALSHLGLAVACRFEDKAEMQSCAWAARDGVELWRVFHDSAKSIFRLDVTGDPPPQFVAIREGAVSRQVAEGGEEASVDFIHEVPLELAHSICGFRPDECEDDEGHVFTVLRESRGPPADSAAAARPGFWARLFGSR